MVNDPEHNPYVAVLVRPAVNLSRLDDVLVITQTQNTMPATMQQDIATSEQKAADILAQRLPSVPPPATVGPDGKPINANSPPPPVRPPSSLHPDQFTPDATPPASSLTPGASYPTEVYPAQPPPTTTGQRNFPSQFQARRNSSDNGAAEVGDATFHHGVFNAEASHATSQGFCRS